MIIETFVFFDINTVECSVKEKKTIKIMELTLIAISRKDLKRYHKKSPPLEKLSLLINPQIDISSATANLTGLSNEFLINQPDFNDKINTINSFLELRKPVCLVACHGNRFDYKVLRSEYVAASAILPSDLLCFDPIKFFIAEIQKRQAHDLLLETFFANSNTSRSQIGPSGVNDPFRVSVTELTTEPEKITVRKIYNSILGRYPSSCQRTDVTAMMILDCVIALRRSFVPWADGKCKLINTIEPFPIE